MLDSSQIKQVIGFAVVDEDGKSVGNVEFVFNDTETGEPEWIGLLSGTLRHHRVLVPVEGIKRAGPSVRVPWSRERVRQAPEYGERDRGGILGFGHYSLAISKEKEQAAFAHYGLGDRALV